MGELGGRQRRHLDDAQYRGYTVRPEEGWPCSRANRSPFQLDVRNLLSLQRVIDQGDTVSPRARSSDFSILYRVGVAAKNAVYQEPISFLFTTTLNLQLRLRRAARLVARRELTGALSD